MFRTALDPVRLTANADEAREVILPHRRNYMLANFPHNFETVIIDRLSKCYDYDSEARVRELERRARATRAALDRFAGLAATAPAEITSTMAALEEPLEAVIDTLDDLASRAEAEEDAPVLADEPDATYRHLDDAVLEGAVNSVQILKTDAPLTFKSDLHLDFLSTVFATGVVGRVGFGQWFLALQTSLVESNRGLERLLRTMDGGRVSSRFMRTVIRACRAAFEIYAGRRDYSAFETAALCLFQYNLSWVRTAARHVREDHVNTFEDIVRTIPVYLRRLADELARERSNDGFAFDRAKLPREYFSPIDGNKYSPGALATHVIFKVLKARGVLSTTGRDVTRVELGQVDPGFQRFEDPLARLSLAFFPDRHVALSLHDDEPLVRAAIDTISAMLLVQRLMYNSDVYGPAYENRFQPAAFFGPGLEVPSSRRDGGLPPPLPSQLYDTTSRRTRPTDLEDASASRDNNLAFLFEHYVLPMYRFDPRVEISGLFPGLIPLCVTGRLRGVPSAIRLGDFHASFVGLVALDLRETPNTGAGAIAVLTTHDALTADCEAGLAKLLGVFDPKKHMARALRSMNVETDSDLIYLLCLGCVPVHITIG